MTSTACTLRPRFIVSVALVLMPFIAAYACVGVRSMVVLCHGVHLDQSHWATIGSTFHVRVNGVPAFAKGANWIPADAIPSRLTKADDRQLVCSAREAHMNMLRIWGGGMYEPDDFYDLCDEHGNNECEEKTRVWDLLKG